MTNRFRELLTSWPLKSALNVDECETIKEALMMASGASANEEENKLARVCAHCSAALREADEVAAELRQTVARQAVTTVSDRFSDLHFRLFDEHNPATSDWSFEWATEDQFTVMDALAAAKQAVLDAYDNKDCDGR